MNMVYRMMTIKLLLLISIDMDFSLGSSRLFPLVESMTSKYGVEIMSL